jgi:AGZA family xanthine/uracil permease-like MFS transporter
VNLFHFVPRKTNNQDPKSLFVSQNQFASNLSSLKPTATKTKSFIYSFIMASIIQKVDDAVQGSFIGRFFEMEQRKARFSTELKGAMATFMTMAYILAVNPRILADSGGPCIPDAPEDGGIFGADYSACIEEVKRELITSTALASMVGCFLMGILANLPIALAPGMGMNAYFAYSVVGFRGTGDVSYNAAVTAVAIEGVIFFLMSVSGLRYWLIKFVPEPVRVATPAAIGCFLAHLGYQTAEGIGLVVSDIATAVTLGACPEDKRIPIVALTESCAANSMTCVVSDAYTCDDLGGVMTSATTWVGILGMLIMVVLLTYRWNSAFVIGISFVTFISWFRNTAITYFPDTDAGDERFEYFSQVVSIEGLDKVLAPFTSDISQIGVALVTFLYVDFLDTSGTLMGLVSTMGYVDEDGDFPRSKMAFAADALATLFGSFFGLCPTTSYIESAAGVNAGARTGLTAVICGIFFMLSIFFAPIIASIPPWATGGSLIVVGALMAKSLKDVKWHDPSHAATAFLTMTIMPLTYSIAYGLIAGIGCWIFCQSSFYILSLFGIEKPVYMDPINEDAPAENDIKKLESEKSDGVSSEQEGNPAAETSGKEAA